MIKAVIFDFFGVLVSERFRQFRDIYFPGDQKKFKQALDLVKQHDTGHITKYEYQRQLADLAGVDVSVVHEYMGQNRPNKQLLSYIHQELKSKFKLGVLSNSGDDYINQMLEPKDVEVFDDILLSYKCGFVKPQPEIFELAAKHLGVLKTECVFVDDSLVHTRGAEQAGMKTILYDEFHEFKSELENILAAGSNN